MKQMTGAERWTFPGEFTPVDSTMIRAMRYDEGARLLEIVFRNGRVYQYENVPAEEYSLLLNAKSKGQYFREHIRGVYSYWRLHRAKQARG